MCTQPKLNSLESICNATSSAFTTFYTPKSFHDSTSMDYETKHRHHQHVNVTCTKKCQTKRAFFLHFHSNEQFLASCNFFPRPLAWTIIVGLILKLVGHKGAEKPHPVPLPCLEQKRLHPKIWELYALTEIFCNSEGEVLPTQSHSNLRSEHISWQLRVQEIIKHEKIVNFLA
jgi:hypothetical protein